jgi:hypothetical protein
MLIYKLTKLYHKVICKFMTVKRILIIGLLLAAFINLGLAQTVSPSPKKNTQYLQLTGVVVDDSLMGLPFVSIFANGKVKTISDVDGFFNLIAQPGDKIEFASISHKNGVLMLDDSLMLKHYFRIQVLNKDTVQLPAIAVYPWPSREEFKQAFLHLNLSETDYERAAKNLDRRGASFDERNMKMDAQANYSYAMNQYVQKVNNGGQAPVNNLLSPIAWAKFIDAVSKGTYKKKSNKK